MSNILELLSDAVRHHYNYDSHRTFANSYADSSYSEVGQKNAFLHAYLSAMIALEHSPLEAETLGNGREFLSTWGHYYGGQKDFRTDTYRDFYNNAVGRAIGTYAKEHGLAQNDVAALVDHAVQSGQAIVSIRLNDPDPRLPFIDSTYPRFSEHREYSTAGREIFRTSRIFGRRRRHAGV